MYLWSTDVEAVYTSMSCFSLLCEEAEIRCSSDDVTVTSLLPNYPVYQELAQTTSVLSMGKFVCNFKFLIGYSFEYNIVFYGLEIYAAETS